MANNTDFFIPGLATMSRVRKYIKDNGFTDECKLTLTQIAEAFAGDTLKESLFRDLWTARGFGWSGYNPETGLYFLNEIDDITYAEAIQIYVASFAMFTGYMEQNFYAHSYPRMRTLFPSKGFGNGKTNFLYSYCTSLQTALVIDGYSSPERPTCSVLSAKDMFFRCSKLYKIIGTIIIKGTEVGNMFQSCRALVDVRIAIQANIKLSLSESSLLSPESLQFMIDNMTAGKSATVTLHEDAYLRLTEEMKTTAAAKGLVFTYPAPTTDHGGNGGN